MQREIVVSIGDADEKCVHCGYSKDVHHELTLQCPADDPYVPVRDLLDRLWSRNVFEAELRKGDG